ncbi:SRPBCC family protein [Janibacter sp. DB-40]|uniref:SRPBCC family protein n=1 Tax=Janibacter sp. DB-40 TaxID=3028808 RepID=UPI0024068D29|nr:SRPBCC family protein [Janibacter sp. DB-40]
MSARDNAGKVLKEIGGNLPLDRLKDEAKNALGAAGDKAISSAGDKVKQATGSLNDITEGGGVVGRATKEGAEAAAKGDSPVKGAIAGGAKGVKDKIVSVFTGGDKDPSHSTNIIESVEVGVPLSVAYNQWTLFHEQADYMRKVKNVDTPEDNQVKYTAKIFLSKRTWTGTIIEQVPDQHIVWRSEGEKGHVDGTISFHELAPRLTKVIVVLEYYPGGFFEKTANLWRAQGRRARSDLRHYARHVQTRSILQDADEIEGWRGEIRDEEVVADHDEVVEEEQQQRDEGSEAPPEDEYSDDEVAEDEAPEEDYEDEGEYPEEEYAEEEGEYAEGEPAEEEGEYAEEEPAEEEGEYAEEEGEYAEEEPAEEEGEYADEEEYDVEPVEDEPEEELDEERER